MRPWSALPAAARAAARRHRRRSRPRRRQRQRPRHRWRPLRPRLQYSLRPLSRTAARCATASSRSRSPWAPRSRCSGWPRSTATRSSTRGSPTMCRSPRPTTAGSASRSPTRSAWPPGIGEGSPQRHPNDPFADENKPRMLAWMGKRTAKDKLDAGFAYPKYPWGPGQVVRYNSVHTFVLAAAMDAYLKRRGRSGRAPVGHGGARGVRADRDLPRADAAHARDGRQPRDSAARLRALSDRRRHRQAHHAAPVRRPTRRAAAPQRDEARGGAVSHEPGQRPAPRLALPRRRGALSPVVLVDPVPHEHRLLLPDPVHVRLRRQPGRAAAERRLGVPVRRRRRAPTSSR